MKRVKKQKKKTKLMFGVCQIHWHKFCNEFNCVSMLIRAVVYCHVLWQRTIETDRLHSKQNWWIYFGAVFVRLYPIHVQHIHYTHYTLKQTDHKHRRQCTQNTIIHFSFYISNFYACEHISKAMPTDYELLRNLKRIQ